MTDRERFVRTVRFEPVDRAPVRFAYGLMPGVLEDWQREGLPESVRSLDEIKAHFGFPPPSEGLPIHCGFDPPFDARVLEDTEEQRIEVDWMGRRTRLLKRYATLPLAMEHPVTDAASWKDYRRRLAFTPGRVGGKLEETARRNADRGRLNVAGFMGFFWFPRDLMGEMALGVSYYEQPELVLDIAETWCSLLEQLLETTLQRLERAGIALDMIHLSEDMAYHSASMVGRGTFERFIAPYYLRLRAVVERYRVPVFSVDTDGCLNELVHWFAACGVNLIGPNEVQAGNDIVSYRRILGNRMAYDGGLDKRVLQRGREAIDEMLDRVIPEMRSTGGGWIAALDHRVIRGTPLEDFRHFVTRLASA